MGGFIIELLIALFVIWAISNGAKRKGSVSGFDQLMATGIPAKGILLQVSSTGTKVGLATRRFDVRQVTVDVEIPGQPPYVVTTSPAIPINFVRDVLPGATVELRVDRKDNTKLVIVGPGTGFVPAALITS